MGILGCPGMLTYKAQPCVVGNHTTLSYYYFYYNHIRSCIILITQGHAQS